MEREENTPLNDPANEAAYTKHGEDFPHFNPFYGFLLCCALCSNSPEY